ncbi:MAG: hypothetical protein KUG78_20405 [Kangiellaceae bacterium]|nr:hypothetical protein [Kangiellaceae bacterium]
MPVKINKCLNYYILDFTGQISKSLISQAYLDLIKRSDFDIDIHTIWDFQDAFLDISIAEFRQIAEIVTSSDAPRSNQSRSAFITMESADKISLESYITFTAHYPVEFKIFDSFDDAETWISG